MINPEELGLEVAKYSGNEALVTCPYHSDDHPSAEFNMETGLFYCFTCGVGKKAAEIVKEFGGIVSDIPIEKREYEEPGIDWRTRFLSYDLALRNEYLIGRHVSQIAIRKLSIRAFDDGIVFPLPGTPDGDICGVQVRYYTRKPKYVFYGTRPPLFPMTYLPVGERSILVEGIFSAIRGRDAGFQTFATMGATALKPALKFFFNRTKVFGVFDADQAGYIAMAKLAAIGVACLEQPFEADERSVEEWKRIISNRANFTMDAGLFVQKAVHAGAGIGTTIKQILKFEKENGYV